MLGSLTEAPMGDQYSVAPWKLYRAPWKYFPLFPEIILLALTKAIKIIQSLTSSQKYLGMVQKMLLFFSAKHKLQKECQTALAN